MKINISKKQYETLIRAMEAGATVYGILGDSVSDDYKKISDEIEQLEEYFLGFAKDLGREELVEDFMGEPMLSEEFEEEFDEAMDDYNDEMFWFELETRLGKRDFERTMTKKEAQEIDDNNGWLPDRIHGIYEGWRKEFEEHGLERLEVKE